MNKVDKKIQALMEKAWNETEGEASEYIDVVIRKEMQHEMAPVFARFAQLLINQNKSEVATHREIKVEPVVKAKRAVKTKARTK
jgi:hypothetical protein